MDIIASILKNTLKKNLLKSSQKVLSFSPFLCFKVRIKYAHAVHDLHGVNSLSLPLRREFKHRRYITKSYVKGS